MWQGPCNRGLTRLVQSTMAPMEGLPWYLTRWAFPWLFAKHGLKRIYWEACCTMLALHKAWRSKVGPNFQAPEASDGGVSHLLVIPKLVTFLLASQVVKRASIKGNAWKTVVLVASSSGDRYHGPLDVLVSFPRLNSSPAHGTPS